MDGVELAFRSIIKHNKEQRTCAYDSHGKYRVVRHLGVAVVGELAERVENL